MNKSKISIVVIFVVRVTVIFCYISQTFMKLDKTKYEEDIMDQRKEEEERLLIVMVNSVNFFSCLKSPSLILKERRLGESD